MGYAVVGALPPLNCLDSHRVALIPTQYEWLTADSQSADQNRSQALWLIGMGL